MAVADMETRSLSSQVRAMACLGEMATPSSTAEVCMVYLLHFYSHFLFLLMTPCNRPGPARPRSARGDRASGGHEGEGEGRCAGRARDQVWETEAPFRACGINAHM